MFGSLCYAIVTYSCIVKVDFLFFLSHVSAAEGHLDVVKFLLLQPGININARDTNDFSPLLGNVFSLF